MSNNTDKTVCGPWEPIGAAATCRRSVMYPGLLAGSVTEEGPARFAWVVFSPHDRKAGSQGHATTSALAMAALDEALPVNGWRAVDLPDTRPPHLRPMTATEEALALANTLTEDARRDHVPDVITGIASAPADIVRFASEGRTVLVIRHDGRVDVAEGVEPGEAGWLAMAAMGEALARELAAAREEEREAIARDADSRASECPLTDAERRAIVWFAERIRARATAPSPTLAREIRAVDATTYGTSAEPLGQRVMQELLDKAIAAAVAAEREACMKVAEEGLAWPGTAEQAARCIVANIRARTHVSGGPVAPPEVRR